MALFILKFQSAIAHPVIGPETVGSDIMMVKISHITNRTNRKGTPSLCHSSNLVNFIRTPPYSTLNVHNIDPSRPDVIVER